MHEIDTIYRVQVRGSAPYNFSQMVGEMLEIHHSMIVVCEFINSCHQLSTFVSKDQSKKYLSNHLFHLGRVYLMKNICIFYVDRFLKFPVISHYKIYMPY